MMKNIIKIFKKYKISVIIALSIIIVGIIGIVLFNYIFNKSTIKTYKNDNYILKYDKSWNLKIKEKTNVLLRNTNDSNLKLEIISLNDENKYSSIGDLIDEIIYNVETQNPDYKLLSKETTTVSKYQYKGYKLLYENNDSQVMITAYKKSDKLVMIKYEANNEYFDILLDSVQNIIYNFNTKEKKYDLSSNLSIDTTEVLYTSDDKLDSNLIDNKTYEIANSNYYVKYSLPSNFEMSEFNSTSQYFHLRGIKDKDVTISTYIYERNIYEELDKNNSFNIYKDYKIYKENKDYSDFKETLTKINGIVDTYLYKNSYNYDKAVTYDKDFKKQEYKRKDENAKLVYALNKNHVLIIDIKTIGTGITKKLLDSIKIEDIKNYSSYVTSTIKDGLLIGELKRYSDNSKKNIDSVIIKLPKEYSEIQKYNNVYSEKIFGLNYNDDNEIYDYKIRFELTTTYAKVENKIESINSFFSTPYGEYSYLTQSNEISLNNRKYIVYNGGYTDLGGIMYTNINRFKYYVNKKVLFFEMPNGGYLVIEISGNGKEISDDIIKNATSFEIKTIDN